MIIKRLQLGAFEAGGSVTACMQGSYGAGEALNVRIVLSSDRTCGAVNAVEGVAYHEADVLGPQQ